MMVYDEKQVNAFLAHVGVKGMHWGHRKASDSAGSTSRPKKLTRKEAKAEKKDFFEKKGDTIVKKALKDPEVLIKLKDASPYSTVITGKEFIDYMSKGGVMDIRLTDIYATKSSKNGPYVLNENQNQRFVRSDKKK